MCWESHKFGDIREKATFPHYGQQSPPMDVYKDGGWIGAIYVIAQQIKNIAVYAGEMEKLTGEEVTLENTFWPTWSNIVSTYVLFLLSVVVLSVRVPEVF